MRRIIASVLASGLGIAHAGEPAMQQAPTYDAALARRTGADEHGMRQYVLVVLRSGPTPVEDPAERKAMFEGHMANIQRLAKAGKLALAGPFGKNDAGWRGLLVFAVEDIGEARALVATDPVIAKGEMVADYYPWYSSAAVTLVPGLAETLVPPKPAGKP